MPNGQVTRSEDEPRTLGDSVPTIGAPSTFCFLTMTTRPTFRAEFKPGDGGTKWEGAVYMAGCINTRSEKGLWSEITTATVPA